MKKHAIPVGSIPCLNYRRALEEETELLKAKEFFEKTNCTENQLENNSIVSDMITSLSSKGEDKVTSVEEERSTTVGVVDIDDSKKVEKQDTNMLSTPLPNEEKLRKMVPAAKIITVNENIQMESLTPDQFNEYCRKLFKFRIIRVLRFRSWHARRKFTKNRKHLKNIQRPTLPDGTKLIKFPVLVASGDAVSHPRTRKEWIMNPSGKSYVCILHEYVQHALKKQPTYEFKELQNAATPYAATVSINELKYGTGYGTSKRQAKSEAARETLEILIPEMKDKITGIKQDRSMVAKSNQKDLSVWIIKHYFIRLNVFSKLIILLRVMIVCDYNIDVI